MEGCRHAGRFLTVFTCATALWSVAVAKEVHYDDIKVYKHMVKRPLVISTVLEKPYFMFRDGANTIYEGNDRYEGFIPDYMKEIARKAAFNYTFRLVEEGRHGSMNQQTGEWNGMMGEVISRIADVAAGPLLVTYQREKYVHFTPAFFPAHLTAVTRRQVTLRSIDDLINNTRMRFGAIRDGMAMDQLQKSRDRKFNFVWAQMNSHPERNVKDMAEGIARARRGDYALIAPLTEAQYAIKDVCDLHVTGRFVLTNHGYALATAVNSPLKVTLARVQQELRQAGTLDRLYRKWFAVSSRCAASEASHVRHDVTMPEYSGDTYHGSYSGAQTVVVMTSLLLTSLMMRVF